MWTSQKAHSFVGSLAMKALGPWGAVCQVCHSTAAVFKAGVQTNISAALSPSQHSLCVEARFEERSEGCCLMHTMFFIYVFHGKIVRICDDNRISLLIFGYPIGKKEKWEPHQC